jgi:hypothetical protein
MDSYPKETFPASAVILMIRNPKGFMDRAIAEYTSEHSGIAI